MCVCVCVCVILCVYIKAIFIIVVGSSLLFPIFSTHLNGNKEKKRRCRILLDFMTRYYLWRELHEYYIIIFSFGFTIVYIYNEVVGPNLTCIHYHLTINLNLKKEHVLII